MTWGMQMRTPPLSGGARITGEIETEYGSNSAINPAAAQVFPEPILWERLRFAALWHDVKHTPESWITHQEARKVWSCAFLQEHGGTP